MRADLEYITGLLDELETLVEDASKAPMNRRRAMVDRSDALALVEDLRNSLPRELDEARSVRREYESILSSAREEAERTVENARRRSGEQAVESEPYRRAQRLAGENLERAERYSEEVSRGSENYREQVMERLERLFGRSLEGVSQSRQELDAPSQRREQHGPDGTEQPPTEAYDPSDEDEEGRRTSSA